VVSLCTVIPTGPHAALLERYVLNRMGSDRFCQAFQEVPSRHG